MVVNNDCSFSYIHHASPSLLKLGFLIEQYVIQHSVRRLKVYNAPTMLLYRARIELARHCLKNGTR
ncbi:hypothetical protein YERSI8AC_770005 [Enterobacterales bacterium 8AC]|nr:hypothetical protein YERSI8AC_770005 [Enterobacterales bacterium 8AC]